MAAAILVICAVAYAAEAEIEEQPAQDSSKTEVDSGTNDKLATAEGRYYGYGGHGHGGYGGHGGKTYEHRKYTVYRNQMVSRITNIHREREMSNKIHNRVLQKHLNQHC